jgi:hypothetical protein
LSSVFRYSQGHPHGSKIALFKEAQQNRMPFGDLKLIDGVIQQWSNFPQRKVCRTVQKIHFHGLPFPMPPAEFAAHHLRSRETRMAMQPPAKLHIGGQSGRLVGEVREHRLRYVLGQVRIAVERAQSGGINEINIPAHQLAERGFRTIPDIIREELLGIDHLQSPVKTRPKQKANRKFGRELTFSRAGSI